MNAKNRNKPPLGVFEDRRTILKKPTSGNDELPAKLAAPKTKKKQKDQQTWRSEKSKL